MLVVNRFRVDAADAAFHEQMSMAVAVLRAKQGLEAIDVVQNLDEPELWALISRWADVGSYRRALQGMESKMVVVPLLSRAIDEPSAYADPADVGENIPRGMSW